MSHRLLSTFIVACSTLSLQVQARNASCSKETFRSLSLPNIHILDWNITTSNNVPLVESAGLYAQPGFTLEDTVNLCRVNIRYTHPGQNDSINTYIGLPLEPEDWNGRFLMVGGGGWTAGEEPDIALPVKAGFSSATTDGGHATPGNNATWGLVSPGNTNWPALTDFASVALVEAAKLGKQATAAYYGKKANYSYWNGCSTGGRQGYMMAQRYPEEFDGIAASAPAINWAKFLVAEYFPVLMADLLGMSNALSAVSTIANSSSIDVQPPACVLQAFTDAAIAACDTLDGVKDGIISLPGQCFFDASSIVGQSVNCTKPSGTIVLTDAHAELVNSMWDGPRSTDGRFAWYGLLKDAPLTGLLPTTCTTIDNCTISPFQISASWIQTFLQKDSTYDVRSMSREQYDAFFRQSVDEYTSVMATDNSDLTNLRQAGTKLLTWHGLQDPLISANGTVDYYNRVLANPANRDVSDYYRFFLAPGVGHCGRGTGFDPSSTFLNAIIAWVENGTAPDTLQSSGAAVGGTNTTVNRTADLCPYPSILTFIGGDPNEVSSFTCA